MPRSSLWRTVTSYLYRRPTLFSIFGLVGASITVLIAISSEIQLPQAALAKWILIAGIVAVSLAVGAFINAPSFLGTRRMARSRTRLSRIRRLLAEGLEDTLAQRVQDIRENTLLMRQLEEHQGRPIDFHVQVIWRGRLSIIASTTNKHSRIRRSAFAEDENSIAVKAILLKAHVVGENAGDHWKLLNNSGIEFDSIGLPDTTNQINVDLDLKWISSIPIFDPPEEVPRSDQVNGVLSVSAYHENARELILNREFQEELESTGFALEYHLEAFTTLREEED